MKKTLTWLVLMVLSLSLLVGLPALAEDATVEFVIWGSDSRKAEYDRLFVPFTEQTGIKVNVNLVALEEIVAKLATQIVSGTAPDVVWLTEAQLPQFIATGNLEDITEIMKDEAFDFGDLFPGLTEKYIKDGKLYAVPFTSSPRVYFYNRDMFSAAGLQDPQDLAEKGEWTMDKMLESAHMLTNKAKGEYGLSIMNYQSPNDWNILLDWTWCMGASFFDEDMTKVTINSPEGVKALQMYSDMIFKDGSQPLPGEQIDFASGKIGMTRNTISFQAQLKDVGFDWDIIPNPTGTDPRRPRRRGRGRLCGAQGRQKQGRRHGGHQVHHHPGKHERRLPDEHLQPHPHVCPVQRQVSGGRATVRAWQADGSAQALGWQDATVSGS